MHKTSPCGKVTTTFSAETAQFPPGGSRKIYSLLFRIYGKVQGVFFRDYTIEMAKRYGLVGFVSNLKDGSVYGEAEGSVDNLGLL